MGVSPATSASAAAGQTLPVFVASPTNVPSGTTPNGTPYASATVVSAVVTATVPVIQQVVSSLTAETAYLGNKVVEAAYSAVNALVNTPDLIAKAVRAVLFGDLATAFATIVQAVKAFLDSGLILIGGIDDVFGQNMLPPTNSAPSASAAAATSSRVAVPSATATGESAADRETPATQPGSGKPRQPKSTGSARRATTDAQPQLTPRSAAGTPSASSSSRSAGPTKTDSAAQRKQKGPGADKSGSASLGRSQNAGGRSASAGD